MEVPVTMAGVEIMDAKTDPRAARAVSSSEQRGSDERAVELLRHVFDLAEEQIERERSRSPVPRASAVGWRQELDLALSEEGRTEDDVVERLRRLLAATPSSASPRFLNQLFGGRDPVATLAEMLAPLLNSSMYTYKVAGPQVLVEQEVLGRMLSKVGYPDGEGVFCPGGSLSNLTAMLLARNVAVDSARNDGLGRQRLVVYSSDAGHYSIRKNAGILGLGRNNVREVATDSQGRMDVSALARAIRRDRAAGRRPLMINATAGTTVLGAFDPLSAIAELATKESVWLHVDGALGGSLLLSESHRHLLDGADLSDSFTWNAHKMMGVPLSCSVVLLRQRGLLQQNLSEAADYLFQAHDDELNPGTRSIQCGRRNDALKLWTAWQLHGDRGYDTRLARLLDLASYATRRVADDPDFEIVHRPQSINVCFRVRGVSSIEICDRLDQQGRLLIGHGSVDGEPAIRLVLVNPDLHTDDIDTALLEIGSVAEQLRKAL